MPDQQGRQHRSARFPTFGSALAFFRSQYRVDYHRLATICGVGPKDVKAWEHDQQIPNISQRKRLLGYLVPLRGYVHLLKDASVRITNASMGEKLAISLELDREIPKPIPTTHGETGEKLTFGQALQASRLAIEMTQDEVGTLLGDGVTGDAVCKWENDVNLPVRKNYEFLLDCFPPLRELPEPPGLLDIDVPDGGKGQAKGIGNPDAGTLGSERRVIATVRPVLVPVVEVGEPSSKLDPVAAAGIEYARALSRVQARRIDVANLETQLNDARGELELEEQDVKIKLEALMGLVEKGGRP